MEENILLIAAKASSENVDRKEFKELHQFKEEDVKTAIDEALKDLSLRQEIKKLLFPEGIIIGEVFFEKFQEFYVLLGFHGIVNELISEISLDIFKEIDGKDVEKLLNFLVNTKSRYFWIYLRSLVFLFQKYTLEPKFISKWFIEVCEKMGNDMASGDFYTAIGNYAFNFPSEGLTILNLYSIDKTDNITLHISSIIMGNIRAKIISDSKDINSFNELENNYHKNENVDKRTIYYGSYLHTYYRIDPSEEALVSLLNEAIKDEDKVKEQVYFIINRYINSKREDKRIVDLGLNWIEDNIHPSSSDMCKHSVIDLLRWIVFEDRKEKDITIFSKIKRILENTLPISMNSGGTWSNIQDLLRDILVIDMKEFEKIVLTILHCSSEEFLHYLRDQQFDFLIHELENADVKDFILKLVTSNEKIERDFGFLLIRLIHTSYANKTTNFTISDERALKISLLEFRRKLILGKEISEYLTNMEPFYYGVSEHLRNEFINEMVFQAVNYPGECLDKWKQTETKSDILKNVISSAELYFENIRKTENLSVNSYCLPELIEANREIKRRLSKSISEGAYEKSIFMKHVKKTHILYGNSWSISYDNKIKDPSNFGEISHKMEFPRIEYIDPEGMALRRISSKIEVNSI